MTTLLLDRRPAAEGLAEASAAPTRLVDPFGRAITYVRLSVTDRRNFRCVYCMAERMTFLPHAEALRLEELDRLCSIFVGLGVTKIRLTGGEPLVRRGVMNLVQSSSRRLRSLELDELTLTTNGSQLARHADDPQLLRQLQSGADHLFGPDGSLPRQRGRRGPEQNPSPKRRRPRRRGRDPPGGGAEAEGPRLRLERSEDAARPRPTDQPDRRIGVGGAAPSQASLMPVDEALTRVLASRRV
jgi:hypothetical protein